jgi:2,4-dienoyl-CoA reductase-like NADH-dependent reductase (Old Yellow Enzyme family)
MEAQGCIPGVQLAHAGRKASTYPPWIGQGKRIPASDGGWLPQGPSPVPFFAEDPLPHALSLSEIAGVRASFERSARLALFAGFRVLELHAAHGYLLHAFLSPAANRRTDHYGGSFENRTRLLREVAQSVRAVWPADLPLFVRISATDWLADDFTIDGWDATGSRGTQFDAAESWTLAQSVLLTRVLNAECGVDLVDCSSGGAVAAGAQMKIGPGYQVPFARTIREQTGVPVAAVGLITEPAHAESTVASGDADLVLLGRQLLREPLWALRAAAELGAGDAKEEEGLWPLPYQRARWPAKA